MAISQAFYNFIVDLAQMITNMGYIVIIDDEANIRFNYKEHQYMVLVKEIKPYYEPYNTHKKSKEEMLTRAAYKFYNDIDKTYKMWVKMENIV